MFLEINIIGILVAAVVSMAIGYVWYAPAVFGSTWMKAIGKTKKSMQAEKKDMPMVMGVAFLVSLLMAFVLDQFLVQFGVSDFVNAMRIAFMLWLGFVATVTLVNEMYDKKRWSVYVINGGYQLVSMLAMALVLILL